MTKGALQFLHTLEGGHPVMGTIKFFGTRGNSLLTGSPAEVYLRKDGGGDDNGSGFSADVIS
jgi:hypothetical protein